MTSEFFRPQKDPLQRINLAVALDNPNTFESVINEKYENRKFLYDLGNGCTLLMHATQQNAWNIVQRIIEKFSDVVFSPAHEQLQLRFSNLHLEVENELRNIERFEGNLQKHYKILKQKQVVHNAFMALVQKVADDVNSPLEKTEEVEDSQDEDIEVEVEVVSSFSP